MYIFIAFAPWNNPSSEGKVQHIQHSLELYSSAPPLTPQLRVICVFSSVLQVRICETGSISNIRMKSVVNTHIRKIKHHHFFCNILWNLSLPIFSENGTYSLHAHAYNLILWMCRLNCLNKPDIGLYMKQCTYGDSKQTTGLY